MKEEEEEEKKKRKEKEPRSEGRRRSHLVWKEKWKKEDEETQPSEGKKKKDGQKLRLKFDSGSLHVVLFTEMPVMSYGNWKQLKCVFSFHNS